jgi:predicted phage tail protein
METSTSGGQKYVAGIALGIDSTGLSQFLVQADRFGLVNSVNGKITTPFVVENSVAYMNGAFIKDGTITNAKVGDLQSTNFISGRSGWRWEKWRAGDQRQ